MNSINRLSLALVASLAFAPAAFASDAFTWNDGSAQKRFAVVGGYAVQDNSSDALKELDNADLGGGSAATLSFSWYITPAIALELWGADKFENGVRTRDAGHVGNIDSQPVALSGQYHFRAPDATIRPFVGLGYYQTNYSGGGNLDGYAANGEGGHLGLEDGKGAIGTVGVDFNINPNWFVRADARYMDSNADITLNGESIGDTDLNPWTVGVGIGGRF